MKRKRPDNSFLIANDGFHGLHYKPENDRFSGKALVVFGGSAGSFLLTQMCAEKFCEAGMNVVAAAYRDVPGAPSQLSGIPVELIENTCKWCKENIADKVGVWGISLGGQLAALAGSLLPELISCVVSVNGMDYVQQGMKSLKKLEFTNGSCFTFRGKDIPYFSYGMSPEECRRTAKADAKAAHEYINYRAFNERAAANMPENAEYMIKLENIAGSVLLLSSGGDMMLPSEFFCKRAYERLRKLGFQYPYRHINYEIASHYLTPVKPVTSKMFRIERENAAACDESRSRAFSDTLDFLEKQW